MACQVRGEGRGRAAGSGCEGVVPSDSAKSSSNLDSCTNLILLCLLFCNCPAFCNVTICNEVQMEEKVDSQLHIPKLHAFFIGLRQIMNLALFI